MSLNTPRDIYKFQAPIFPPQHMLVESNKILSLRAAYVTKYLSQPELEP